MLHLFAMKQGCQNGMRVMRWMLSIRVVACLALLLALFQGSARAQGFRMSADFLPLEVGNRWIYEVHNEQGQKIGDIDFSVEEHTIISGRSFYVLTRFPFVPSGGLTKLIRYDRDERQYLRREDEDDRG